MNTLESFDDDGVWHPSPNPGETVSHWPTEIHIVGGPYCGVLLHPHSECIHTVELGILDNFSSSLPHTIVAGADGETLALEGPLGVSLHRREGSDRLWQFVTMIEPREASSDERFGPS
jgi:hypothetical protein